MASVGWGRPAPADGGLGAAEEAPQLLVQLAPAPIYLAGRDDLLQVLDEKFSPSRTPGPRFVALCGLGGIGKTALALSYAHRHLSSYGLVWQFQAADDVSLSAAYAELAGYIRVGKAAARSNATVLEVHNALAARTGRWLLIFDDAMDPASLRNYLPPVGDGDIVITSQDASWPPAQRILVDVLEADDATAFLINRTGDTDVQAAAEVASMLGQLPLALEQAAAYTVATSCGLNGYAELFKENRTDLLVRGQPSDYRKTVATTWQAAFDQLQESVPDSVTLLRLLACYGPYPVPLSVFQLQREDIPGEVTAAVAAQVRALLAGQLTLYDAVAALGRYSLISIPVRGTVTVHQLVQAITSDQIPIEQRPGWKDAAAALLRSALPEDPKLPENWPTFRSLAPHVLATLPAADMRSTVQFLRSSGSYGAAVVVQEHITQDALDRGGPRSSEFLTEMANFFYMKGEAGNRDEARQGLAGMLRGLKHVVDPEAPFYLQLQSQLARWTGAAGDPAKACALFRDLLPVLERVFGEKDSRTLTARFNYAAMLAEAGDPAGARDLFAAMVPIYDEVFGANDPDTLGVRASLAYSTGMAGEPGRARELYAMLLPVLDGTLGPVHHNTIAARLNMAYMTAVVDNPAAALDLVAELLPMVERSRGPDDAETIRVKEFIAQMRDGTQSNTE